MLALGLMGKAWGSLNLSPCKGHRKWQQLSFLRFHDGIKQVNPWRKPRSPSQPLNLSSGTFMAFQPIGENTVLLFGSMNNLADTAPRYAVGIKFSTVNSMHQTWGDARLLSWPKFSWRAWADLRGRAMESPQREQPHLPKNDQTCIGPKKGRHGQAREAK